MPGEKPDDERKQKHAASLTRDISILFTKARSCSDCTPHSSQPEKRPELTRVEEGLSLIPHGCVVPAAEDCISTRAATSLQAAYVPVVDESADKKNADITALQLVGSSNTALSETADSINDIEQLRTQP